MFQFQGTLKPGQLYGWKRHSIGKHSGTICSTGTGPTPVIWKKYFSAATQRRFIHIAVDVIKEPMFILLAIACSLYFILGEESKI